MAHKRDGTKTLSGLAGYAFSRDNDLKSFVIDVCKSWNYLRNSPWTWSM